MQTIQITGISLQELQAMLNESAISAVKKVLEEQKKPSEWEDISIQTAAKEMNCSTRTIKRRMKELKIQGYKVGKTILIQRKDLKKFKTPAGL
ncbi:excisionase family DNA-binding protein [Chitinophaga varians]|uniref:excisionase family DNA-binding protein n=1 Tax=Chitinophaga varians TaxID=2202339 RepID=UPI00165F3F12|nr:excisionase family DNA-binding protein [Chitinophaga varians]MBC9913132.1 excisionase family DNA-binding protein [Chitinophaga varians]